MPNDTPALMDVLNLYLGVATLAVVLVVAVVVVAVLLDERDARLRREAAWEEILHAIEDHSRETRHAVKGLTAALRLEERVRELRQPLELAEPPPE